MHRFRFLPALLLPLAALGGEHLVRKPVFDAIAQAYSGEAAQENDRQIVEYHRIQGSPMMSAVAERVVLAKLKAAGIEANLEQFASDGATRYQTHISPMGWDMRSGELWVESVGGNAALTPLRLCRYSDVPMCVSTYSKGGEWTGELVDVGAGTAGADYQGRDVRGKVVLASGYAENVVRQAVVERGAIGAVIYPASTDRAEHPHMVRYNGVWPRVEELGRTSGSFQISASQYATLRGLMARGAVRVRGTIDATLGPGQLTVVHAYLRGSEPGREVVVIAHLDHPKWSANDNASGSAAIMEMAATLHSLIKAKKLPPLRRTIHFMWVPEYFGTIAYLTKHPEARACGAWDDPRPASASGPCVIAALNLDMVGEDTVKTNGRFYITRTPDSVPSFLNALLSDVLEQTREAALYAPSGTRNYWPAEMAEFAQGSDHEPFLGIGVPATMLGHDPDWTHHTSEDTVDKTDASEFRRVGVLASAAAVWLAGADSEDLRKLSHLGAAAIVVERAQRIARSLGDSSSASVDARIQQNATVLAAMQNGFLNVRKAAANEFTLSPGLNAAPSPGTGPRRLTLLPIAASAYESLTGDDKKWWDEQARRFSGADSGGSLPTGATFGALAFETVNFMDGRRTAAEIAALLSAEYDRDIDAAWVKRLVRILDGLGLVATR